MRIAFVTPEFVTEYGVGGGLGNYLARMSRCLVNQGHEVHVFVSTSGVGETIFFEPGIEVTRVPSAGSGWLSLTLNAAARLLRLSALFEILFRARSLGRAVREVEKRKPFDLIQSADYQAVGLLVRKRKPGVHVIRCSSIAELWARTNSGGFPRSERMRARMERLAMRRADSVYAPSKFVADYLKENHGISTKVIRPPSPQPKEMEASVIPEYLPQRFFLHFGQLKGKNGTDWLCQGLKGAFEKAPDMRVVMVGVGSGRHIGQMLEVLGEHRHKVLALYPVPKDVMYGILCKAEAVIIPSRVDNLPNTLIESLVFRKPVIGTAGASIDELIEHGENGVLVEKDSVGGLAVALVDFWCGRVPIGRPGLLPESESAMREDVAVNALVSMVHEARSLSA